MSKDNSSAAALLPSVREARMRAGLTQERLAELAGVSRRSVIRWEAGHVVPHRSELSFLLDALSIDGDERKDWLRTYAAGKKPDDAETAGMGKRLRTLRERSGISVSELANRVGAARSTLARWEKRKAVPTSSALSRLVAELGCLPTNVATEAEDVEFPILRARLDQLQTAIWHGGVDALDLRFADLVEKIEELAESDPKSRLLGDAMAQNAQFLCLCRRRRETLALCRRVIELQRASSCLSKRSVFTAALLSAECRLGRSWRTAQRGLQILNSLEGAALGSELLSWKLGLYARCFSLHGRDQPAVEFAKQALAAVAPQDAATKHRRLIDLAEVLARTGAWEEALAALPELGKATPYETTRQCLLLAEITSSLAQDGMHWQITAANLVQAHGFEPYFAGRKVGEDD